MNLPSGKQITAASIADNVWFIVISRAAMLLTPFVLSGLVWLALGYLDQRFEAQSSASNIISIRVDGLSNNVDGLTDRLDMLGNRVTAVETSTARGRAEREAWQAQMAQDVRDMRGSIVALSNNVAALTATVQTLTQQQRQAQR